EDPRLVAYALDDDDLAATIDDLVADLVPCWPAQVPATSGEDRLRVVQQALAAAHDAGLDPPGADLPPPPGLAAAASGSRGGPATSLRARPRPVPGARGPPAPR